MVSVTLSCARRSSSGSGAGGGSTTTSVSVPRLIDLVALAAAAGHFVAAGVDALLAALLGLRR